jgi:hypothetical protein
VAQSSAAFCVVRLSFMSFEEEARLVHEHIELIHKLNLALADALLKVAEESETPPTQLAQMLGFGGGGISPLFQPLVMRFHEEQQRRFAAMQRDPIPPESQP